MLLIAILSLSVVLAVSAEVDVKTKPATLKAVKDSKDSLKTNYDKAHDAMVAKFSKRKMNIYPCIHGRLQ